MKETISPKKNYKHVCLLCGNAYESNRSTSRFCSNKHRSLYNVRKKTADVPKKKKGGELVDDYNAILQKAYNDRKDGFNKDGWSPSMPAQMLRTHFMYTGPLPTRDEIIIVGGFAIKRRSFQLDLLEPDKGIFYYGIKPAKLLTQKELSANAK